MSSSFEEGDDPSLSSSGVIVAETADKKEEGIAVPPTPKFNVYTGMLLFAFLGTGLATFMMYREFGTYDYVKEAVEVKQLTPAQIEIPTLPSTTGTAAAPASNR